MPQEIERKFLVKKENTSRKHTRRTVSLRDISAVRGTGRCGYAYVAGRGISPLREHPDASGISRYEWEKEIPLNEAEELMKL